MEQSTILTQNVDTLFSNLENFTQNEGLIGKPLTHGDKTFIPVVSVTLGYGSGSSANKNQQGSNLASQSTATGSSNMLGGALAPVISADSLISPINLLLLPRIAQT